MKNAFVHQGTHFEEGTPLELCELLLRAKEQRTRIVVDYGDIKTNTSWGEAYDISGYIGRSTGITPILLLVHNSRSTGGGALLTSCILSVKTSRGKKLLYQNKINK